MTKNMEVNETGKPSKIPRPPMLMPSSAYNVHSFNVDTYGATIPRVGFNLTARR